MSPTVRTARHDDYDDIVELTSDVWADRAMADYIPDVFRDWVDDDGADRKTLVVDVDGHAVGLAQAVMLTETEAWFQGMRIDSDYRGQGLGSLLTDHLIEWAADAGASVGRSMVFSWNEAGLGQSLAAGFEAVTSFRWVHPEPRDETPGMTVGNDPATAWRYWQESDGRDVLSGLALDSGESWALSTLTRDTLDRLATDQAVLTVGDKPRGLACRVRTTEADGERLAEYAVGVWSDVDAARALFTAIAADAATLGVDGTRVLIPETPRHVAQAAYASGNIDGRPDFVFEIDGLGELS
ncbi:N-acetyltransferase GCN5 [Haloarcula hispanica N601]|uniref:GNAT family N-acetyltransferase n=3 Tax=Haloarcula hispanica TaxID=51589 RepID=A0A482T6B1_HALHI|nr:MULTISPECIES: GNAT family N-acetyltransferase [Haloarcula]AEM56291.1 GNAT family acetyltransferase [Haloarcula hispanica ATCC 33960]AHB65102.1 N-acetyltransferase GCN5 [Haloarcula hispanica N601]AJF26255.1 GCN5 family acetyltransferase [Haloarcula sp. CBA1115]KAA9407930.1 GNAT family N-acetyltransferase [Haloarcula sp. CBA1131]KAA9409024.1 GNAT family N-acetyltransferase [Haloarcula hispanica]